MNMGCCNGGYHEFNLDWFLSRFKEIESEWDGTKEWLKNWVDSFDIEGEVKKVMQEWVDDGTIENIINQEIFGELDNRVTQNSEEIEALKNEYTGIKNDITAIKAAGLFGKQIDWFGDSILYGESPGGGRVEKAIPQLFAEATGATCINHAVSGSTISNNAWEAKVITQVNNADLSKSDYVIVQGGINDYLLNYPIISAPSSSGYSSTFREGLIAIFNAIANKNAKATIIMLTMFPNNAYFNGSLGHDGENFEDYNRAIKEVCRDRCIRCINMTNNSINRSTFNTVSSDGTHFTQTGYIILTNHLINMIDTTSTDLPVFIGTNILEGLFPIGNVSDTLKNNALSSNSIIRLDSSNNIAYSSVSVKLPAGTYSLRFRMCVINGTADVYFGNETYQRIGGVRNISGSPSTAFAWHNVTINPTSSIGRVLFLLDKDTSSCDYVIITDISLAQGTNPIVGEVKLENRADVSLNAAYFNLQYPLQFKQRDRLVSFNGPVQTTATVPTSTELVDLSNYNFAKGRYCPPSAVIFAAGLDGNIYPLQLDFKSYKLTNLKQIPANTNLGITTVIDIS